MPWVTFFGKGSLALLLTEKGSPFPWFLPQCRLLSSCRVRVWAEILPLQCAVRICLTRFFITAYGKNLP